MAITPQQARQELARRELEKRQQPLSPEQEIIKNVQTNEQTRRTELSKNPIAKKMYDIQDYIFPQPMTGKKFDVGEHNLLGDISTRPARAIRSAIFPQEGENRLQGYMRGAVSSPEPTNLKETITDIVADPTNYLTGAVGLANKAKIIKGIDSLTDTEKIIQKSVAKTGSAIKSKLPKIMGERWLEGQAKLVQKTASGLEKSRGLAYDNIYNKLNKATVPQIEVSDILQKYDLIDELGVPAISDLKSLKAFSDELAQYVPQQIKTGKVFGKGGFANPKIRAEKAAKEIKNLIYKAGQEAEEVGAVEKGVTSQLKSLDKLAREQLYPKGEKLRKIGGYSPEPETSGVTGAYKILMGSEGSAGQRLAIRRTPKSLEELKPFIAPEKQNILFNAIKNSKQLAKDMGSYRHRQILKSIATGGGLGLLANYLSRRMVGGKVFGGGN